jgi:hypothetical protein
LKGEPEKAKVRRTREGFFGFGLAGVAGGGHWLIIDEFSALMAHVGVTAEPQIRSVVQRHQNLGYIFAGPKVGPKMDMTGKHGRPFKNGGSIRYLRPVPVAESAASLREQLLDCRDSPSVASSNSWDLINWNGASFPLEKSRNRFREPLIPEVGMTFSPQKLIPERTHRTAKENADEPWEAGRQGHAQADTRWIGILAQFLRPSR